MFASCSEWAPGSVTVSWATGEKFLDPLSSTTPKSQNSLVPRSDSCDFDYVSLRGYYEICSIRPRNSHTPLCTGGRAGCAHTTCVPICLFVIRLFNSSIVSPEGRYVHLSMSKLLPHQIELFLWSRGWQPKEWWLKYWRRNNYKRNKIVVKRDQQQRRKKENMVWNSMRRKNPRIQRMA